MTWDEISSKHPTDISYNDALELMDTYDLTDCLDKEILNELKRYAYCQRFGIAPYSGTYEEQPKMWLYFIQLFAYRAASAIFREAPYCDPH